MGVYNRDYFRDRTPSMWGLEGAPVVKWLIIANILVFLVQVLYVRDAPVPVPEAMLQDDSLSDEDMEALLRSTPKMSVAQEWLELDTRKVVYGGQVWRLLTSAFCHDRYSIFHIFINMLCLYWFGCTLEGMYGSREFLFFYLTAAIAGSLAFVGLDLYTGSTVPALGASGAVMGVMMLYTMHFPYEEIRVCWFIPVQMCWVMLFFVIWDAHPVLLALAGDQVFTGIASAAHLGGLTFGFLYARYEWRLAPMAERLPWLHGKSRGRPGLRIVRAPVRREEAEPDASRLDQVLAKISQSGRDSLTDEERAVLQEASERLKNQSRQDG